ncbi:MAG: hypothetical protein E7812_12960 [Phenylobacterium sp.]|nr:MAG: hypothetical protein E7812_12960 [Phenylobacterium sp.]
MLTFKRLLAGSTAIALGTGFGIATSVFAQVATPPTQSPVGGAPQPGGTGSPATTQDQAFVSQFRRDADVTVMARPREGYEARGIRVGAFLVYPQLNVAPTYDDNIFATSSNTTSDTIWKVNPLVTVQSDWNRHSLGGYASVTANEFQQRSSEDTTDYSLGANGRIDVDHATQVTGRVNYMRSTEPRTSANSPTGALKPVRYDLLDFSAEGRHEFDRLLGTLHFDSQTFDYSNPPAASGGVIDETFRNRTITTYGGRLDYALSPKTALFVDLQGENHSYDHQSALDPINRDSKGVQALAGVDFEVTALMRGNIGFGYRKETFSDPAAKDLAGLSADASLEWFPTQLTTVTVAGSRTIQDSAVFGSPAYLSSNVTARVDHELLRNVILTGQVGYGDDKYTGIVREDHRTSAGVGASYLINRTLGVSVNYNYNKQETVKGVGNDFKDNRVAATLTVQY